VSLLFNLINLLDLNPMHPGLAFKVYVLVLLSTLTVSEVHLRTIRQSNQEILIGECDFYLKEKRNKKVCLLKRTCNALLQMPLFMFFFFFFLHLRT